MRLIRLAAQPSRVADDVRAALASLGRGETVIGGFALLGVHAPESASQVDAVVVLPRGVLVVVGVDLPDPAVRLEAPLYGRWKADGWPLVHGDDAVNPAAEALARARTVATKLAACGPADLAIGTIVAVGPYVGTVEQPPADLAGLVRVLHPTPTSMLAATVSLATAERPLTASQAGALLHALAPDTPGQSAETLAGEGFDPAEHPSPPAAGTPDPAQTELTTSPPGPIAAPAPLPTDAGRRGPGPVRWLPFVAIGLLAALLVVAIVLATNQEAPSATPPPPTTAAHTVDGVRFTTVATGSDGSCAVHATGDVQANLAEAGCTGIRRGSFDARRAGAHAAVSVAVLRFADAARAASVKELSDTPGSGAVTDVAVATGRWRRPVDFAGAAYASDAEGGTVRLVLAAWIGKPSTPDDPELTRIAKTALTLPVPG